MTKEPYIDVKESIIHKSMLSGNSAIKQIDVGRWNKRFYFITAENGKWMLNSEDIWTSANPSRVEGLDWEGIMQDLAYRGLADKRNWKMVMIR